MDAAMEERIGKFVNDSPERFTNCPMKMVDVDVISKKYQKELN